MTEYIERVSPSAFVAARRAVSVVLGVVTGVILLKATPMAIFFLGMAGWSIFVIYAIIFLVWTAFYQSGRWAYRQIRGGRDGLAIALAWAIPVIAIAIPFRHVLAYF